ncbi:MAG TPA: hypothetical protein VMB47_02170 [Candidatus Aquilonibacter sp.]|nr:hypothetical protein [Candidatus Aquilonibacter sp.]
MKNSLLVAMLGALLLLSAARVTAQTAEEYAAPLPAAVTSAKTIFIHNDGNTPVVYEAFCDAIRDWGKYRIVASADRADLIVTLSYREPDKGTASWGGNSFVSTQPKREKSDAEVTLTIYDAGTNEPLWSASDPQKHAMREKNRDRQAIQSVQHLVSNLELGASASQ